MRQAAVVYFQWPFLILNVLQGVLIFLLIDTYKEWMALLSFKGRSKHDATKETSFTSPRKSEILEVKVDG